MKRNATRECFGRLGLVAMLLLLALPTTGRVWQVAAMDAADMGARHPAHHGLHQAAGDEGKPPSPQAPRSLDCDYCPLLGAMAPALHAARMPAAAIALPRSFPAPLAPRLAWLHPNGLGSRGPPSQG